MGIRVRDIAVKHDVMDMPDDIVIALTHLNLSQIHDALSYYYEQKAEIDNKWKQAIKNTEALK